MTQDILYNTDNIRQKASLLCSQADRLSDTASELRRRSALCAGSAYAELVVGGLFAPSLLFTGGSLLRNAKLSAMLWSYADKTADYAKRLRNLTYGMNDSADIFDTAERRIAAGAADPEAFIAGTTLLQFLYGMQTPLDNLGGRLDLISQILDKTGILSGVAGKVAMAGTIAASAAASIYDVRKGDVNTPTGMVADAGARVGANIVTDAAEVAVGAGISIAIAAVFPPAAVVAPFLGDVIATEGFNVIGSGIDSLIKDLSHGKYGSFTDIAGQLGGEAGDWLQNEAGKAAGAVCGCVSEPVSGVAQGVESLLIGNAQQVHSYGGGGLRF